MSVLSVRVNVCAVVVAVAVNEFSVLCLRIKMEVQIYELWIACISESYNQL